MNNLTTKKTLKDLIADANKLVNLLIENEGAINQEIQDLMMVEASLPEKVESYHFVLAKLKSEASFWQAEADRYQKVADGISETEKRIKTNLKLLMLANNIDELNGLSNRFKLSKTKPSLKYDIEQIPDEYKVVVTTLEADKDKLRQDIESGKQVKGAELIESYSLRDYVKKSNDP